MAFKPVLLYSFLRSFLPDSILLCIIKQKVQTYPDLFPSRQTQKLNINIVERRMGMVPKARTKVAEALSSKMSQVCPSVLSAVAICHMAMRI